MRSFGFAEFMFILEAARWTLALSLLAFVGGSVVGLVVALARTSESRWAQAGAGLFIQVFQGTPLLLQLFLIFFGAPVLGLDINPWVAAGAALILNSGAFLGEIWRGCIQAVPKGQWEASASLAMTRWQQLRHVVLPQALRLALPPTVGFSVQVVKNTSITSIIGVVELTRAGQLVNNATFQPFQVFLVVAVIYFALCFPLSTASKRMERKLHAHR